MLQIATYNNKIVLLFHSIFFSFWEKMILKKKKNNPECSDLKNGQLMLPFSPLGKMYRWKNFQSPVDFFTFWGEIFYPLMSCEFVEGI